MKKKPVLGLTMGDPAGVGPEICWRALFDPVVRAQCVPILFGDAGVMRRVAACAFSSRASKGNERFPSKKTPAWGGCRVISLEAMKRMPLIDEPLIINCAALNAEKVRPGKVSAACGRAAYCYIEQAISAALAGKADGVVTAPIHKESLNRAGIKFPGHTEIFSALTGAKRSCMMLYSDPLTVSMATTHIGYAEAPKNLSVERILNVIELTAEAMRGLRGRTPRLGVCGLNPHAGEHGLFGNCEEERLVQPALTRAGRKGLHVTGPLAPDAAFTAKARRRFDAIVTLYHDQGHIPFKMLAFETGVNITLGLPIVRTSVDHGTAFDIAWQGVADPTSLLCAIRVAAGLCRQAAPAASQPNVIGDGRNRRCRKKG